MGYACHSCLFGTITARINSIARLATSKKYIIDISFHLKVGDMLYILPRTILIYRWRKKNLHKPDHFKERSELFTYG